MEELVVLGPKGTRIASVDAWFEHAPPQKGRDHWKDGKSAKELAKAWFRDRDAKPPADLVQLLASHSVTRDATVTLALPERITRFDGLPGGGAITICCCSFAEDRTSWASKQRPVSPSASPSPTRSTKDL